MKYHLLLLEDIVNHGRKGELVYTAPGFARNFLLPQGKALLASRSTVRMREKLQTERDEQAAKDRKESLVFAEKLKGTMIETVVKVDPDGHMYGSVTIVDIAKLLEDNGFAIHKKNIALHHPIRTIGSYQISLKLPENVDATFGLEIKPDRKIEKKKKSEKVVDAAAAEGTEEGASEGVLPDENKLDQ